MRRETASDSPAWYTLSNQVTSTQSYTATGNSLAGNYTRIGTKSNATTKEQVSGSTSFADDYTEVQNQSDAFTLIGNTISQSSTLTETGNITHSLTDSGVYNGYSYTVNEYSTQPFSLTQTTNGIEHLQTTDETFDTSYTMTESSATSTSSWDLSENGVDTISQYHASGRVKLASFRQSEVYGKTDEGHVEIAA